MLAPPPPFIGAHNITTNPTTPVWLHTNEGDMTFCQAGTENTKPFNCPADYVYTIEAMDKANHPYRLPGFMSHPKVT